MYMDLYGVIISLQEAHRWLEAGYLDNAKFDIELASNELWRIVKQEKEKSQKEKENPRLE